MNNIYSENQWASKFEIVHQINQVKLYKFPSIGDKSIPLLVVFSLFNKPYILDLAHQYSLINKLLENGIEVYLIDWGEPSADIFQSGIASYISIYLHNIVEWMKSACNLKKINMLGVCQGGVFSICYAAMFPENVNTLIPIVTPVNFHTEKDLISNLLRKLEFGDDLQDKIAGFFFAQAFSMLNPFATLKKTIKFLKKAADSKKREIFFRVEQWAVDCNMQAGRVFREFVEYFYQKNLLIKNQLLISGIPVNLNKITMPVLNIMASDDKIVPNAASLDLENYISSQDYSSIVLPKGHVGIFLQEDQNEKLSGVIINWLKNREYCL